MIDSLQTVASDFVYSSGIYTVYSKNPVVIQTLAYVLLIWILITLFFVVLRAIYLWLSVFNESDSDGYSYQWIKKVTFGENSPFEFGPGPKLLFDSGEFEEVTACSSYDLCLDGFSIWKKTNDPWLQVTEPGQATIFLRYAHITKRWWVKIPDKQPSFNITL